MNSLLNIEKKINNITKDIVNLNPDASLLCVCKKFPVDVYEILLSLGQNNFAENYIQEAIEKRKMFAKQKCERVNWHFIGKIQSNKIKDLCEYFSVIHSLDQIKHAEKINQVLKEKNKSVEVLVHVNLALEQQKSGIKQEDLQQFLIDMQQFEHIDCIGLMTFPPYQEDPENNRAYFKALKKLLEDCRKFVRDKKRFIHLSMGVSNDYRIALTEGATMIRLGSSILGLREKLIK